MKVSTHMQKIHKTEMGGYIFFFFVKGEGSSRLEVYLLQVFSVKRRVSQKRGGSEGSERLARFSLSGVSGPCGEQKQAALQRFKVKRSKRGSRAKLFIPNNGGEKNKNSDREI